MYPKLLEIGPISIYSYGLLLVSAYLLGLQVAVARGRSRGLDGQKVMDLGIAIIVSALVGAKLLLFVVEFDHFTRDPAEVVDAGPFRRRLLRRPAALGRGGVLVRAPSLLAAVGDL